jgi:hypothetical protein
MPQHWKPPHCPLETKAADKGDLHHAENHPNRAKVIDRVHRYAERSRGPENNKGKSSYSES